MLPRIQMIPTSPQESFLCFMKKARGFPFKWHFHPEYELTLIVHSHGQQFVGDAIVEYGNGDLALLGPNLPHTWRSTRLTGRHEAVVLQFRADCLGAGFFDRPELRPVQRLLDRSRRGLLFRGTSRRAVGELMRELLEASGPSRIRLFLEILERLARTPSRPLASAAFQPEATREDEQRIARICDHIQRHADQRLSLGSVAQMVHMSPSSLSRFFKRVTGRTFNRYLNELRVGQACRQLIESDRTVAEICYACGFHNLANFNRRFRQLKGVTPTDYRESYNQPVKRVPVVGRKR
jgi:AraC-like DNA-binding protein